MGLYNIQDDTGDQILIEPRHEKTCFCICENKGADQLRGNRAADHMRKQMRRSAAR